MARTIYTLLLLLLLPWALLHLLWRALRQPDYLRHWGERFGFYEPRPAAPIIWLHAVSVGETRAAQPLVTLLRQRYPDHRILFTHMTPTGRQTSETLFGDTVERIYLPYDYPWAVRRFLQHYRPEIGIIMETEIWPNLVAASDKAGIPMLLVNARLSERSARRYACYPALTREALSYLNTIGAQSEADASRLVRLGAKNVTIAGNMKFDIVAPATQLELGSILRSRFGKRPVLLAASTRDGEESLILDALRGQPIPGLLLVIVPRHPQRFNEVAILVQTCGFKLQRRSEGNGVMPDTEILLGDSMGEMFAYYSSCDAAFIGGSLLDHGSQNLIEACAVGVPVLVGPSTYNFAEAASQAIACGAAQQVGNAAELIAAAAALLADEDRRKSMGEAGSTFAKRHRGASERTLTMITQAMR